MIERTPDIEAQLVRIKHTFHLANGFARKNDPASRVIAIIMMDYVAESALKTAYWHHPDVSNKAGDVRFPDLLKDVAALAGQPGRLASQVEIGNLHTQRNLTQHRNLVPSGEDVSKYAAQLDAFLRDLFARFFAVDLDALTLASLVTNAELREHLQKAQNFLREGLLRQAVEEAAIGLDKALTRATDVLGVRAFPFLSDLTVDMDARRAGFTREQAQVLRDMGRDLQQLRLEVGEKLLIVAIGLDYAAHARFKAIAPRIWWNIKQEVNVNHSRETYSPDEANEILEYSLNQIVRLEAMGALVVPEEES